MRDTTSSKVQVSYNHLYKRAGKSHLNIFESILFFKSEHADKQRGLYSSAGKESAGS